MCVYRRFIKVHVTMYNYECDRILDCTCDRVCDCVCVCVSFVTVGVTVVIVYLGS